MDPRALPALPPSEVEWEELLVKLDIAPRAMRAAAEDAPAGAAAARTLASAAAREAWFGECLERLRAGQPVALSPAGGGDPARSEAPADDALARYCRSRERNFSQLQRRGVDVWQWRSADPEPITAYQLAHFMAWSDGETLRELRAAAGRG